MRLSLLCIALLLPQVLLAQFNAFKLGSYVLTSSSNARQVAKLKFRSSTLLLVKGADDKTTKLTPAEVLSFRIGSQQFVTAKDFQISEASFGSVDQAFVEVLDSGQIVLMRYEYTTGVPMSMGPGGVMQGGGKSTDEVYLLRWANESSISSIPANKLTGGGRKFRDALLPHLRARNDLAKLVEDGEATIDDLPALIRALNTGQAYVPLTTPLTND